jgi:hypothetical protein
MRDKKIEVRLNGDELARLEELRAGGSRAAAIRSLIRGVGGVAAAPEPTHDESLRVLAAMARDGKVAAAVALERALRETADDAPDDFFPDWLRD